MQCLFEKILRKRQLDCAFLTSFRYKTFQMQLMWIKLQYKRKFDRPLEQTIKKDVSYHSFILFSDFECEICLKGFYRRFELKNHIRMKHGSTGQILMMHVNKRRSHDIEIDYDKEVLKSFLNKFIQSHQRGPF
ncbi:UNKNOWN [Stylonychia lemnae]|uniref:C2H2-type domain-containing protein n=1 Tax=Stylonychia lemnae TaxID=5949 RepID=A0A078AS64_STYLE|nr:UNKNOWN [Stylonychia lemnae]|eukprot:CDW85320.1 UNKNOWN [Stylonychia lemnae]